MDDRVKQLLKDLGEAISEAVSDSARVESILQAIRDSGYEARLMLEAIIAVQSNGQVTQETLLGEVEEPDAEIFTAEDRRFLKLLKIDY
ncbi:MAG TPA: hypothetical protein VKJ45_08685 [Blastocatellia bacterium]|nr:hypothetical protein [Blastocatellia bacterium]